MTQHEPASDVALRGLARERAARKAAETLLEQKSLELYDINQNLRTLNAHLEESETRYRQLVDLIPDAIWIHSEGHIVFLNAAALRLFGAEAAPQLLGTPALNRVPHEYRHQMAKSIYQSAQQAQTGPRCTLRLERLDASLVEVEFFACTIRRNNVASVMNVAHDITERRQHEMAIEHQATHDLLTGLPNRALLLDRLTHAIQRAERNQGRLAVMFVDLDKFKTINDSLGHGAGDALLRMVAVQLKDCVRESDTVARLGGDEFVLLLDDACGEVTPSLIAQRVSERLALPVMLGGQHHIVTGSIGISVYPEDGAHAEALLQRADIAMYRAKERGRNFFQFFTREMQDRVDARGRLEQGLRRALERDEFVLHYQPQVDLVSGRIIGLEALIRWQSAELGLVPPLHFIPLAEESDLILAIGEWVLHTVCTRLKAWQGSGLSIVPVAINVAASQFSHQDIDRMALRELAACGLEPKYLELELTESLSMQDPEASIAMMHSLKDIGIAMSIDDFGTGYSNLSYLKRFPVDKLKIDQSFTRGLTQNPEDRSITRAVIRLAHSLGLRAIAEGVETEGQLRLLAEEGCDEIQGYYFSRPLPEPEIIAMLKSQACLDLSQIDRRPSRQTLLLIDGEVQVLRSFALLLHNQPYELLTALCIEDACEILARQEVSVVISDQQPIGATGIDFFERIKQLYPNTVRILMTGNGNSAVLAGAINQGAIFKYIAKPWDNAQVLDVLGSALAHYER